MRYNVRKTGFTLTEVLVAVLVASLCFLALTRGIQFSAKNVLTSRQNTTASQLAESIYTMLLNQNFHHVVTVDSNKKTPTNFIPSLGNPCLKPYDPSSYLADWTKHPLKDVLQAASIKTRDMGFSHFTMNVTYLVLDRSDNRQPNGRMSDYTAWTDKNAPFCEDDWDPTLKANDNNGDGDLDDIAYDSRNREIPELPGVQLKLLEINIFNKRNARVVRYENIINRDQFSGGKGIASRRLAFDIAHYKDGAWFHQRSPALDWHVSQGRKLKYGSAYLGNTAYRVDTFNPWNADCGVANPGGDENYDNSCGNADGFKMHFIGSTEPGVTINASTNAISQTFYKVFVAEDTIDHRIPDPAYTTLYMTEGTKQIVTFTESGVPPARAVSPQDRRTAYVDVKAPFAAAWGPVGAVDDLTPIVYLVAKDTPLTDASGVSGVHPNIFQIWDESLYDWLGHPDKQTRFTPDWAKVTLDNLSGATKVNHTAGSKDSWAILRDKTNFLPVKLDVGGHPVRADFGDRATYASTQPWSFTVNFPVDSTAPVIALSTWVAVADVRVSSPPTQICGEASTTDQSMGVKTNVQVWLTVTMEDDPGSGIDLETFTLESQDVLNTTNNPGSCNNETTLLDDKKKYKDRRLGTFFVFDPAYPKRRVLSIPLGGHPNGTMKRYKVSVKDHRTNETKTEFKDLWIQWKN